MINSTLKEKLDKLYEDSKNNRLEFFSDDGRNEWREFLISVKEDKELSRKAEEYFCEVSDAKIDNRIGVAGAIMISYITLGEWDLGEKFLNWYVDKIRHKYVRRKLGID